MSATISITIIMSLLGLGIAYFYMKKVTSIPLDMGLEEKDGARLKFIHGAIANGAMAFLRAEYRILTVFVIAVAFILGFANSGRSDSSAMISLSFVVGALASGLAGFLGMKVATKANNRTTHAAESSLARALNVAFSGGSVMGLSVVGLGVLGVGGLLYLYSNMYGFENSSGVSMVLNILS